MAGRAPASSGSSRANAGQQRLEASQDVIATLVTVVFRF